MPSGRDNCDWSLALLRVMFYGGRRTFPAPQLPPHARSLSLFQKARCYHWTGLRTQQVDLTVVQLCPACRCRQTGTKGVNNDLPSASAGLWHTGDNTLILSFKHSLGQSSSLKSGRRLCFQVSLMTGFVLRFKVGKSHDVALEASQLVY